jgi:hypothetical protein
VVIAIVELHEPEIDALWYPRGRDASGGSGRAGQAKVAGQQVAGTAGNESDRYILADKALHGLHRCPVTTIHDDPLHSIIDP